MLFPMGIGRLMVGRIWAKDSLRWPRSPLKTWTPGTYHSGEVRGVNDPTETTHGLHR